MWEVTVPAAIVVHFETLKGKYEQVEGDTGQKGLYHTTHYYPIAV